MRRQKCISTFEWILSGLDWGRSMENPSWDWHFFRNQKLIWELGHLLCMCLTPDQFPTSCLPPENHQKQNMNAPWLATVISTQLCIFRPLHGIACCWLKIIGRIPSPTSISFKTSWIPKTFFEVLGFGFHKVGSNWSLLPLKSFHLQLSYSDAGKPPKCR